MKIMKPLCFYLTLVVILFGGKPFAIAQTTIYSTNFGTTANVNPLGWTFTGLNMNVSEHSPKSTGYTGASGQAYLAEGNSANFVNTFGTPQNNSQPGISTAILIVNTSGYTNVAVSFGMRKSAGYDNDVTYSLEWSNNGTTYTPITFAQPSPGTWGLASGGGLNLPTGAGNQPTLYLKWSFNRTGPNFGLNFRIDDFSITGAVITCTPPSINSASSNAPVCAGTNLNLFAAASGSATITYSWTGPNGFSSALQNPIISAAAIAATGTYTVTATNSCGSASANTSVTVNPLPIAIITPGGGTTFCQGGSVALTSSLGTSYLWSTSETTSSINVSSSGNYTVQVTDGNGCSASSSAMQITVNPLPAPPSVTAGGNTTFCQGDSVILTASIATGYLWSTGETTQSITVDSTGNYSIIVTDTNGCSASSLLAMPVTVLPLPSTDITADGPTSFCPGGSVTLTVTVAASYLWSTGATTQSIFVDTTGNYSVTVTGINGCTAASYAPVTVTIIADPTDINRDGITNNLDFLLLLGQFNTNCTLCREDINEDGVVNNVDFLMLLAHFNMSCQ